MTSEEYFSKKNQGLSFTVERLQERPPIPPLSEISKIHISAVCGKAMAPLAGLLISKGYNVTGSDHSYAPPMSDVLLQLGLSEAPFSPTNLEGTDLVIIGNALSPDNVEAVAARELGIPYISVAEALSLFVMGELDRIVVAGTHGKTTTTGLLVKAFLDAGKDPSFLIGGVVQGENTAYALGSGNDFIIEGDEYDTAYFDRRPKFLHYKAKNLIITSVELDHTDIYQDEAEYFRAFEYLVQEMSEEDQVWLCADNAALRLASFCKGKVTTYGFSEQADLRVIQEPSENGLLTLRFILHGEEIGVLRSPLTGQYNALNIACVVGVCIQKDISFDSIQKTVSCFSGMKKRQELLGHCSTRHISLIDDFAHHPTAVGATLSGMREVAPRGTRRIVAIFEPRSNSSRRKAFEDLYPEAFKDADIVLIKTPPFLHNDNVKDFMNASSVCDQINTMEVKALNITDNSEAISFLQKETQDGDLIITMSNGHFDFIQDEIIESLQLS